MSEKENEIQVIEITEELLREKLYEVRGRRWSKHIEFETFCLWCSE